MDCAPHHHCAALYIEDVDRDVSFLHIAPLHELGTTNAHVACEQVNFILKYGASATDCQAFVKRIDEASDAWTGLLKKTANR